MSERNSRLMSIGEVAKSLHITRRMILNYEDKGILLPDVKTGSGGNRYYTPETLTRIRAIRRLQTLGISLDEIKLYFEDAADLRDIIARLETLRDELNLCIEKLQLRVRENSNDTPIIRTIPAQTVYVYHCASPTVEDRKEIFRDVIPAAMRFHDMETRQARAMRALPTVTLKQRKKRVRHYDQDYHHLRTASSACNGADPAACILRFDFRVYSGNDLRTSQCS